MDKELVEALNKLLDEKFETKLSIILENNLDPIRKEMHKNTLLLEDISKKVETIAELQGSFHEQLERAKDKDGRTLADRLDVIEMAVTDTSSRVKDIHKELTRVVRTTAENWAEIVELKAVR